MKVLIPSDNRDFVAEMATAYQDAGCDVVTGAFNFDLGAANYDLVHYQWPEELSGWQPPSEGRLAQISERLKWWECRCPSIATVHNFYPHGYERNWAYKKLYEMFYANTASVLHFSETSKALVCDEFTEAQHERHIVTTPWNFDRTLSTQKKRGPCRSELGFNAEHFVVLVMGALRSWKEIELIGNAFASCRVPQKKLLMAGRYNEKGGRIQRKLRQMRWRFWLWRNGAKVEERYVPEDELYRFLDSSDIVVIPRIEGLNSGITSLAMTFGRMVIAPAQGPFLEHLAGTGNLLYEPGNPQSLARAMEQAAVLDREQIGAQNRQKAHEWSWDKIVSDCLNAVDATQRARR